MKYDLSVVILTRNEEVNIKTCIQSCSFASEILVMDDESTDSTVAIASSMGARVISRPLQDDWASQENAAIAEAKFSWVFCIDADECVTPELEKSICQILERGSKVCCWVRRINCFKNSEAKHGVNRPYWLPRLFPKDGIKFVGRVHQHVESPFAKVNLKGDLLHFPYPSWNVYFDKLNRYAKLSALKYSEENRSCSFVTHIVLRPVWAFFKSYILDLGFLDGRIGFIFSAGYAYYTLNKYAQYYQMKHFESKL